MSNDAMTWAWAAPIAPGPKFVLVALADHGSDHSGEDWACFPSVQRLMARTAFKRSAVEKHLKTLEAEGWIVRKRRKRPDGKLGVYDYTLRRERLAEAVAEVAEKARAAAPPGSQSEHGPGSQSEHGPCSQSAHGPCSESDAAMLTKHEKPCSECEHEEPSIEPSIEPSQSAGGREPGDAGFENGLAAWPLVGQGRTDLPLARAAWSRVCGEIGVERLVAAVVRYAANDPDLQRDPGLAPALERWLNAERFRHWLSEPAASIAAAPSAATFAGPAEIRALAVRVCDEAWARSYLDRCAWLDVERQLIAPTSIAFDRIAERLGRDLKAEGVVLTRRGAA